MFKHTSQRSCSAVLSEIGIFSFLRVAAFRSRHRVRRWCSHICVFALCTFCFEPYIYRVRCWPDRAATWTFRSPSSAPGSVIADFRPSKSLSGFGWKSLPRFVSSDSGFALAAALSPERILYILRAHSRYCWSCPIRIWWNNLTPKSTSSNEL